MTSGKVRKLNRKLRLKKIKDGLVKTNYTITLLREISESQSKRLGLLRSYDASS